MKKIISLSLFLLTYVCSINSQVMGRVETFGGVRVFSESKPVAKYETLGEINFAAASNSSSSFISMGATMMFISDSEHIEYNEIRNGLVGQSVMANREVNGIIINGKKATLIKINNEDKDADLCFPNKRGNTYLFIDATPIGEYDYVQTVKAKATDWDVNYILNTILKRTSKLKQPHNAAIFRFVTGGRDYAEIINIR